MTNEKIGLLFGGMYLLTTVGVCYMLPKMDLRAEDKRRFYIYHKTKGWIKIFNHD